MSIEMTRFQKQELGNALRRAGYLPEAFVYEEAEDNEGVGFAALIHRETSDKFAIISPGGHIFSVRRSIPGTTRESSRSNLRWDQVTSILTDWAEAVKRENEAIDPWRQEAEDMASDDSHFGLDELPRVDKAIDESLDDLRDKAVEHGIALPRVEAELLEVKNLLKKTARNSTKKEWVSIFKGIILEKLIDWGMQTELFQNVLHVLITSAHDVAQLAEHASRHIP